MSTSLITTDTIVNSGSAFTYTSSIQQLVVLEGVVLASTNAVALAGASTSTITNIGATIMGTLISDGAISFQSDNGVFHVTETGSFISTEDNYAQWGIADFTTANEQVTFINDGTLGALQTNAILLEGDSVVQNSGTISGGANGVFMGVFGAAGDVLVNSGIIRGGLRDVSELTVSEDRFGNGVIAEGDQTRIINREGGLIVSSAPDIGDYDQPAGIEYQGDISGARLRNSGDIVSMNGVGIDMVETSSSTDLSLINFGTVEGAAGSLRGSSNAEGFINRGVMNGDVDFLGSADEFDNRNGAVTGDVIMGDGDDFYTGRLESSVSGTIYGGSGEDTLYGGNNSDVIEGGSNDDDIRGYGGDDILNGDEGDDTLFGLDGDDELFGNDDDDRLFGGRGADVVNGGSGADRLYGGDGDDRILSGGGRDNLYGGSGADQFSFVDIGDSGTTGGTRDRIFDFDASEGDTIALSGIDADSTVGGNQVFTFIDDAAFSNTAGELRYTSGGLVEADVDGDGSADFQILLTTAPDLTEDAFLL